MSKGCLFQIKNNFNTCHTEIKFLGIKFNFLNKKLIKRPDYTPVVRKIKEKYNNNQKIRVGFLVSENQKWNAENLYNLLEKDEHFEPVILITLLTDVVAGKDLTRNNLDENYKFFSQTNKRIEKAFDEEKQEYIDLNKFGIDILFYQQPWGLSEIQNIDNVSKYALCCYFSYGTGIFKTKNLGVKPFHEKLFAYFLASHEDFAYIKDFVKTDNKNMCVVGSPKLDIYKNLNQKENNGKKTIIYSAHFSYSKKSVLRISTFNITGKEMLDFAKNHREYNWIFKPHPNLKYTLYTDKNYGKEFAENYYNEWAKIGQIHNNANYFDLFINSDLLITDACSFLVEYMPTLKPIIRFTRKDSLKPNIFGKKVLKGIYEVDSFQEFKDIFEKLFIQNEDELLNTRKDLVNNLLIGKQNASEKIIKNLLEKINL